MFPPAPARFSTITDCPMDCDSFCATTRAIVSVPPPGAKPTVSVTGCVGVKPCAKAFAAHASTAPPRAPIHIFIVLLLWKPRRIEKHRQLLHFRMARVEELSVDEI